MEVAYWDIRLVSDGYIDQIMLRLSLEDEMAARPTFGYREDCNTLDSKKEETQAIMKDIFGDLSEGPDEELTNG